MMMKEKKKNGKRGIIFFFFFFFDEPIDVETVAWQIRYFDMAFENVCVHTQKKKSRLFILVKGICLKSIKE